MSPSRVAKAIASPSEAIARNSASGSRRAMRCAPCASSTSFVSTGLRRWASPERTAGLFAGAARRWSTAPAADRAPRGLEGSRSPEVPGKGSAWSVRVVAVGVLFVGHKWSWRGRLVVAADWVVAGKPDKATGIGRLAIEPRQPHTTGAKMQCRSQKRHIGSSADRTSWALPNVCLQNIHKMSRHNSGRPAICGRSQKRHIVQTPGRQSCVSG